MRSARVAVSALLVLSLLVPVVGFAAAETPAVAAQTAEDSNDSDGSDDLTLSDLTRTGTAVEGAPQAHRFNGQTETFAIRHDAWHPISSQDWYYLGEKLPLRTDTVEIKSIRRPAEGDKQYILRIAHWNRDTKQVQTPNGTVTRAVANVTRVETKQITFGQNYDSSNVTMASNFGGGQVTMCLQEKGESNCLQTDSGVRWGPFEHNTLEFSQSVPVNSQSDLMWWGLSRIAIVAILGLLVGAGLVKKMLEKTGVGPMLGWQTWALGIASLGFVLILAAYQWTVRLFTSLPYLIGGFIAFVGVVAMLEVVDRSEKVVVERSELTNAKTPSGEEARDALLQEMETIRLVRLDGSDSNYAIVRPGIRPFLARLFGRSATLSFDDQLTEIDVQGKWDRKLIADPDSEQAIDIQPPTLAWNPPLSDSKPALPPGRDQGDDDGPNPVVSDGGSMLTKSSGAAIVDGLSDINWSFLVTSALLIGGGWHIGAGSIDMPFVGAAVGAVPVAIMSITPVEPEVEFESAPVHMRRAVETFTPAQREYSDAKDLEASQKEVWKERAKTKKDAEDFEQEYDQTLLQELMGDGVEREIRGAEDSRGDDE